MVLAIQRGGVECQEPVMLRGGDHLLLQGTWQAPDRYLSDPKVLVVDSPGSCTEASGGLGARGAYAALAILLLLVVLRSFNIVPVPIAAVICAAVMLITGVLPQFYLGIDWNTCILIGAMIAPATAMTKTSAAVLIGDYVVDAL